MKTDHPKIIDNKKRRRRRRRRFSVIEEGSHTIWQRLIVGEE